MLWNTLATVVTDKVPSLIIDETGGNVIPSVEMVKLPAASAVQFGDLLKAGVGPGEFVPIALGDTPVAISLADRSTVTDPLGNDFAALKRDATVKSTGIRWPAGASPAQVTAIIDALRALRIFVRQGI